MNEKKSRFQLNINDQYSHLEKKIRYVLDTFCNHYKIPQNLTISYGIETGNSIIITPIEEIDFFSQKKGIPENITHIFWKDVKLPILFHQNVQNLIVNSTNGNSVSLHADVLLNAFYFLSCWQEHIQSDADSMGRFPFESSIIKDLRIETLPVVNYYFDILNQAIDKLYEKNGHDSSIQKNQFKVGLTHDVDQCTSGWLEDNSRMLIEGNPVRAIKNVISRITNKDIWFNFDKIMRLENELDIKSSFYFIPTNQKTNKYPNADYDLSSNKMQSVLKTLESNDWEIGIHGSIGSAYDAKMLKNEINKFKLGEIGGRFHYLMMSQPFSWKVLDKVKIMYDSTLGFPESIGFRNGYCFPFNPYDFENETPFSFWEFPMNVMDKTLMQSYYMGLRPDESLEKVKDLVDEVRKWNGYLVINWHNNTLSGFKYKEWFNVYYDILKYCLLQNAEITSIKNHLHNFINSIKYNN
ncbi:MAG: hypothetical protein HOD97_02475 [Candidatus Marinimicrobia bacterium]|jgi:hypothetical protein|nr:hypothetical protein [Candidatus Neomarinimicrobiota bacterium]MBT3840131.1 hypothetical protein [Candidatus Neomarinimicrobiota bacterium]MBT4280478.1 hypothetical protein [Candidatus Neomarinimicrobiota bacterium]MBT4956417.1 hypothetical protein [Candidatus Neomarinimicrobiota bacterium]MBT7113297.1 hypothetical protein [Candidatus Neomarinimicrobiota bacterium]